MTQGGSEKRQLAHLAFDALASRQLHGDPVAGHQAGPDQADADIALQPGRPGVGGHLAHRGIALEDLRVQVMQRQLAPVILGLIEHHAELAALGSGGVDGAQRADADGVVGGVEIGRATCRERV